ncbi:HNH endonuclease [Crocosphaera sp. UHCC 0190]|uniref:HNH endonuclease n=1 Tax=unclassified Crocosphaera TaxID=2623705 RepID=UPI002B20577D|nr:MULTISPECIES: HNH endonuclease [unclassified Crocosphaera]MEA5511951.1 HNH endonuclease [Crocosphaera sp. UHCC 0190]MEA5536681.1 HNH endonuclease [Crocosphaera sp. XPORK-15E]
MTTYLSEALRKKIETTDKRRCCYCLTSEANSGIPMTIDHILPRSTGGDNSFENVCLACRTCNEYKGKNTTAIDPLTGEKIPLFNPRQQQWKDHFSWSADGTKVEGLTAIGRGTVVTLRMNHAVIVSARRRWVSSGWHPPID